MEFMGGRKAQAMQVQGLQAHDKEQRQAKWASCLDIRVNIRKQMCGLVKVSAWFRRAWAKVQVDAGVATGDQVVRANWKKEQKEEEDEGKDEEEDDDDDEDDDKK